MSDETKNPQEGVEVNGGDELSEDELNQAAGGFTLSRTYSTSDGTVDRNLRTFTTDGTSTTDKTSVEKGDKTSTDPFRTSLTPKTTI